MAVKQICVLVAFLVLAADALSWKNCDGGSPVQIREVNISPDPSKLRPGTKFSLSAKFQVRGDAGLKYKLHLKVQRKAWFWITIPCIGGKIGSCTITNPKLTCDAMKVLINEQVCPLPRKVHTLQRQGVIPKVSVPSWLASGRYRVKADLKDLSSGRRIACVEAETQLNL